MAYQIPAEMVARFRADAQRRLERVEAAWLELGQHPDALALARQMARELHTLKGDSHIIGFRDASQLCHKLEELLAAAERHQFQVGEELDLAVTMSIGFLNMIIRRKLDAPAGGIDLPGFVRHIDEVLADVNAIAAAPPAPAVPVAARADDRDALSAVTRDRLAVIATELYVGALATEGATRRHLMATWSALVDQVNRLRSMPLDQRLLRHAHAARLLAGDLGRQVAVAFEVGGDSVGAHALDAIDEALGHAVRNAIDHGIRPPAERVARGKPARGVVRIASRVTSDRVEVAVSDDGDGIDLEAVRRRAVERRLVAPEAAAALDGDALIDLLFAPGFSTRDRASELSGRGVGLDAVRAAVRGEGGDVAIQTAPGAGTSVIVRVPHQEPGLEVHCFASAIDGVLVAVPHDWEPAELVAPIAGLPELDFARAGVVAGDDRLLVGRDGVRAVIPARWPPVRAYAVRVCPTPAEHPLEIVRVDDADALLIRPHRLVAVARPPRARRPSRVAFEDPTS